MATWRIHPFSGGLASVGGLLGGLGVGLALHEPAAGLLTGLGFGMIIRTLDGSRHHAVRIQPTIPVTRTLEAIRGGRDEFLEAAIHAIADSETTPPGLPRN